uniref:Uncharacterized protein n=1 Tax=Moorena producens (strain JHB) TaxID=1454205 RepID=A0A1D9G0R1_MOOP1
MFNVKKNQIKTAQNMVDCELSIKTYLINHDYQFILLMQSLMGETPKTALHRFLRLSKIFSEGYPKMITLF